LVRTWGREEGREGGRYVSEGDARVGVHELGQDLREGGREEGRKGGTKEGRKEGGRCEPRDAGVGSEKSLRTWGREGGKEGREEGREGKGARTYLGADCSQELVYVCPDKGVFCQGSTVLLERGREGGGEEGGRDGRR